MGSISKNRREARQLALDVLYQAEIRDQLPTEALSSLRRDGWTVTLREGAEGLTPSDGVIVYASALVEGVEAHVAQIDELIDTSAQRWSIDRLPVVDKNLLRLGIFELLWQPDIPTAVVINEAIELAKSLSTEESGGFINGILGRVAQQRGGELPQR